MGSRMICKTLAAAALALGLGWSQAPRAQEEAPLDAVAAAALAAKAVDTATALADLLDVAKQDLGPSPEMGEALKHARELPTKPERGMGEWMSGEGGAVQAEVTMPEMCRALMDRCAARPASDPGVCGCAPASGGVFAFTLRIKPAPLDERK